MKLNLIVFFIFIISINVFLFYEISTIKKFNLENFGNDNIEHLSDADFFSSLENRVREILKEEYNHDIEAIRNLGAISKSLLTGKNYHSSDITLSSTAYFKSPGVLCYSRDPNDRIDSLIGAAFNDEEAKSACSNEITCKGFSSSQAGGYTFYNNIQSVSNRYAEEGDSCFQKQETDGDLENNILTIPANVRILGNITVDGNGEIGNAYIGTGRTHGNWAEFSHKDRGAGSGDYSIISNADGHTLLNSKGSQYIGFRNNNNQSSYIPSNGHIVPQNGTLNVTGNFNLNGEALNPKMLNNIKLRTFATKNRTKTRYVRIQSNNNWMHFRRFWVYTTDGKELIQELNPNNTYKIPDANFTTNHGGHTHGLHNGHRQAYKVRPPYGNHHSGGGWEQYYHSFRHTRDWWQVDLGAEYEILRVGYDYRHDHGRQWHANPAGVDTLQLLNSGKQIWKSMPFNWHASEYLPDDSKYITWYNVPDG